MYICYLHAFNQSFNNVKEYKILNNTILNFILYGIIINKQLILHVNIQTVHFNIVEKVKLNKDVFSIKKFICTLRLV